jgi:hypothetical protein
LELCELTSSNGKIVAVVVVVVVVVESALVVGVGNTGNCWI